MTEAIRKLRSAVGWLVAFGLLLAAVSAVLASEGFTFFRGADPYIHLRLASLVREQGIVDRIPQAEDIGWSESFADKEFLYHAALAAGNAAGGDAGAVHVQRGLIALFYLSLAWLLCHLGGWRALAVGMGTAVATHYLQHRLFMLRPQVLAMTEFLWILAALFAGRPVWIVAGCALFALSYHALFVPLAAAAAASAIRLALRERRPLAPFFAGAVGLALGSLANPYFPGNLEIGVDVLELIFRNAPTIAAIGSESQPPGFAMLLRSFAPVAVVFGVGAAATVTASRRGAFESVDTEKAQLLLLCIGGITLPWLLSNARAAEYFVPVTALLAGAAVPRAARWHAAWLIAWLVPAGIGLANAVPEYAKPMPVSPRAQKIERALTAIPAPARTGDGMGAKVFTCTWPLGGFVFYFRPDLRFSDLLEPYWLYKAQPEKFEARRQFVSEPVDRHQIAREAFDSDYVLCDKAQPRAALNFDPAFERIYPRSLDRDEPMHLFRVKPQRPATQVREFRYRAEGAQANVAATWATPVFRAKPRSAGQCFTLEPTPAEQRRLAGGVILGLGGVGDLTLELDGWELLQTRLSRDAVLGHWIELPEPLSTTAALSATLCPTSNADVSFSLAILTEMDFAALCPGTADDPLYCELPFTAVPR